MEEKRTVCGPRMEGKWETIGDLGKGQRVKRVMEKLRQERQDRHAKKCMTNLAKLAKLKGKFVKMVNFAMQKIT